MKFLDLMPELRNGYAVTKKSWNNPERQVMLGSNDMLVEKNFSHSKFTAKVFSVAREAADSNDWVVVKKGE